MKEGEKMTHDHNRKKIRDKIDGTTQHGTGVSFFLPPAYSGTHLTLTSDTSICYTPSKCKNVAGHSEMPIAVNLVKKKILSCFPYTLSRQKSICFYLKESTLKGLHKTVSTSKNC